MSFLRLSARRKKKAKLKSSVRDHGPRSTDRSWMLRASGIAILLWSSILVLFHAGGALQHTNLAIGQQAKNTMVATVNFETLDLAATELMKEQAVDSVLPVFSIDESGFHTASRNMTKLFARLAEVQKPSSESNQIPVDGQIASIREAIHFLNLPLSPEEMLSLAPPGREGQVQKTLTLALRRTWMGGIVSEHERRDSFASVADDDQISIWNESAELQSPVPLSSLKLPQEAVESAVKDTLEALPDLQLPKASLHTLLHEWVGPNLQYEQLRTDERRAAKEQAVDMQTMTIAAGTTLVEAGQPITQQILVAIMDHDKRSAELYTEAHRMKQSFCNGGLLLLGLLIAGSFIWIAQPSLLHESKVILLLAILSILNVALAKGILYLSTSTTLIQPTLVEPMAPLALAPLMAALLVGGVDAVAVGVWTSVAVAILYGHSFPLLIFGLVISISAALSGSSVRRRSRAFRSGLLIGVSAMITMLFLGMVNQFSWTTIGSQSLTALATCVACSLLGLALLPLFEILFGITTDIRLLEHSDMGHPLLQRLAIDAPGTYHHSLMVANLAHAAASDIGLNALLARVSAYYHDIGKLTKPEMFMENIQFSQNPHDDLSPSMSALVVISHVKEGVALAQKYKLPSVIVAGIEQHHGTSLISYFHHRARQQAETNYHKTGSSAVSEEDFRYPGPKPASPEMGILLLADSIEAASRSMEKPTSSRIEALVTEIVDSRLLDGQLDNCDLTMAQIGAIKKSFMFTLTNTLHSRIAYPKNEDRTKQSPDKAPRGNNEPSEVQQVGYAGSSAP